MFSNTIQRKITDYFPKKVTKIYGYNPTTNSWHCMECGVDMGSSNSRQLCGKSICYGY